MVSQAKDEHVCAQCGAPVPPDLRYCLQCYFPVAGAGAARAHVESAGRIPSTHRADPTIVYSPEKHQELLRQSRRRKRTIIAAASVLLVAIGGLITLNAINRHRLAVAKTEARNEAALKDLGVIGDALERFRTDVGRYPTNAEGLTVLVRRPAEFPTDSAEHSHYWYGPYLENVPEVDPWGDDYVYQTQDGGRSFVLFSHGPGGETGSDGRFQVGSRGQDN